MHGKHCFIIPKEKNNIFTQVSQWLKKDERRTNLNLTLFYLTHQKFKCTAINFDSEQEYHNILYFIFFVRKLTESTF